MTPKAEPIALSTTPAADANTIDDKREVLESNKVLPEEVQTPFAPASLEGPRSNGNGEFSLNNNVIKEEENSLDEDQSDGENKKLEKDIINLVK